jgi:F-box/leucine-rich repeat protein 2/20
VSLEFCSKFSDADIPLLAPFSQLTSLNLNYCTNVTDEGVGTVMKICTKLTSISLFWMPTLSIMGIVNMCAADNVKMLTKVNLSGVRHLTDDAIELLACCCPRLVYLNLTRLEACRDKSLEAVAANCPLLETLNLYACSNFTDAGLTAIAEGCPRLHTLDITGSHSIFDGGISTLVQGCPQLSWLSLQWCIKLTDGALHTLGAHARRLQFLSIHGNVHMTAAGLEHLRPCSLLETLDCNGCRSIPDRSLAAIQKLCPQIKVLLDL